MEFNSNRDFCTISMLALEDYQITLFGLNRLDESVTKLAPQL